MRWLLGKRLRWPSTAPESRRAKWVMPGPVAGDAIHVAVAAVHRMDYMLTWNVRHLANRNKLEHLRTICRRVGFIPPQIVTPDLLWETN